MIVLYKCSCHASEREVCVPDRVPDTDILEWMEIVQGCIGYDHKARSPHCRASKVEYAKIPIEEDQSIGVKATRQ
jgi:hypothetical protein